MGLLDRAHAAMYDRITAPSERRWLGAVRRRLLADLSGRVLEIGAGTGANFQHYPPQVQVVAVEPSDYFLQRARPKLATARASISLCKADAQALPFADHSFDAAVGTLVFCTIPNPRQALDELRRVTRSGAPLLLVEHVRAGSRAARVLQDLWNPCQNFIAGGCNVNRDTAATVREAGFQVAAVEDLPVELIIFPQVLVRAVNPRAPER